MAGALGKRDYLDEALAYAQRAIPVAEARGGNYSVVAAELRLGEVLGRRGDSESAAHHFARTRRPSAGFVVRALTGPDGDPRGTEVVITFA